MYGFGSISSHDQGGGLAGIFTGNATVAVGDTARALAVAGGGGGYESSGGNAAGSVGLNGNDTATSGGEPTMRGSHDNILSAGCVPLPPTAHFSGGGGGYAGGGRAHAGADPFSNPYVSCGVAIAGAAGGSGFVAASAVASTIQFTPAGSVAAPNAGDADYVAGSARGTTSRFSRAGGDASIVVEWLLGEIGSSKSASIGPRKADGTYDVTYTIIVQNTGDMTLNNLALVDDLTAADQLGTAFVSVVTQPAVSAVLINPGSTLPAATAAYNGTNSLIGAGGVLIAGDSYQVVFTVNVDPAAAGAPATLDNTATASGDIGAVTVTDKTDTGTDPTTNPGENTGTPTVLVFPINAEDNDFSGTPFNGADGGNTTTVFSNDTLNGVAFVPADVTPTITADGGLTGVSINPDGTLTVPADTPAGTYNVTYQILM